MVRTTRPTKLPGFTGNLDKKNTDTALVQRVEALTEAMNIRLGRAGDPQDRAVTLRELIESGLAEELRAAPFDPNNPTRANIGVRPPSQFSDTTIPPAPTGVSATGGYSLITVFWDFPLYTNHSLTEIWRFDADTIGDAILVGTSGGRSFVDSVGESADYYYWVRHVSESGIPGPFHDTAGEHATTSLNVTELLSVLNGAVTSSQLASSLLTRINLIDDSAAVVGSVSYKVAQEAAARTAAVNAAAAVLQSQINDIITVQPYDNAETYAADDLVTYGGNLYRALGATTGNLPTNPTYWTLLGAYSSLAEAVDDALAAIVELNNVSAGSTSANALALYGMVTAIEDPTTGLDATRSLLLTEYYTSADTDTAIASATTGLASTTYVTSAISGALASYTNTATLTSNYYTKTATDSAIASAVLNLASTTYVLSALGAYTTTATLTSNYYTRTATDSAISAALTTYVTTTALNTALSSYTTTASLTTNYYTRTATDSAIAAALTTYVTTTALNTALGAYTTTASLTSNYYTRTATDSAIAAALTTYVSTTALTTALSSYTTTASLTTNYYTKTATDSAISAAVLNLASTSYVTTALGSYTNTATLQATYYTIASAASLEAQYMIKLDVNGRVSGFGLHSSATASEFIILADRFSIVSQLSNDVVATPFIVQATSTTIGGVSVPAGIYMSDAFIMNGSIVNAKIANAAIDDAKISNLSANKITTGTLDTSRLNIDGATLISEDGVLMIGSLSVDNLSAGIITTDKILGSAVNSIVVFDVTTANALPTNATYESVASGNVIKDQGTESLMVVKFQVDATATGSGQYALYVRIKQDGVVVSRVFSFLLTRSFAQTVNGEVVLTGLPAGTSNYSLECQANISGSGFSTCTVNSCTLTTTEIKR
jgi:hypothetical protein